MVETNLAGELREIGRLIRSAKLLQSVRNEVHAVCREGRIVVMDGSHGERHAVGSGKFEVVIVSRDDGGDDRMVQVARRIKTNMPDIEVEQIVANVIGVRTARRGTKLKELLDG